MERKTERKHFLHQLCIWELNEQAAPFGLPGVSGQLTSLFPREYIPKLTEKPLHCGNDISSCKKLFQLPGKYTERTFLAVLFFWESGISLKERP